MSPLLLSGRATTSHTRRLAELSEKQRGKLPLPLASSSSIEELRYERVLDSSIAGALTGGLLSGGLRESHSVHPASLAALRLFVSSSKISP